MQTMQIPYGKTTLTLNLSSEWAIDWIAPAEVRPAPDPITAVRAALQQPAGGRSLEDFRGARSAAIAVNDKTRPVPHQHLLPPLLEALHDLDIPRERITFLIATGTHPPMPPEEYADILPAEIVAAYPIFCHDAEDEAALVDLGRTARGTPVQANRLFLEADLRIVVGNVEPHQFVGFSGGVKTAAIGLAGLATINANHLLMTRPEAQLGRYEGNPAREDVEEIGRMMRVDFALNALLNGHKQIVDVLAGDPVALMQAAIPRVRRGFQVEVPAPYDLLIVSPGGHPKDINVYQSQKGLAHAALIAKPGAQVLLAAACPEGTGSDHYEEWLLSGGFHRHEEVIAAFVAEGFRVGPHKAYQIARDASRLRVQLLSSMDPDFVRLLLLEPIDDLQAALDVVLAQLAPGARIGVMPAANATIPVLPVTA